MNTLYYGDNLKILREHIKDASVDLIYLDPPFNSNRNYNVLFKNESGIEADSQIRAFDDTWHWNLSAAQTYNELINEPDQVGRMIEAFHGFVVGQGDKGNQMMAYLVMMAVRLKELHRVLKPTGSLYLHCDPTASHYLKILLDTVFAVQNYKNEISWQRTSAHNDPSRYGRVHDIILFYTKGNSFTWNQQYDPPDERFYKSHDFEEDEDGKLFRKRDLTAPGHGNTSGQYEWKGKFPPTGRMWSYTKDNMTKLEEEGRIVYTKTGMPRLKIYADDLKGVPYQDLWARPELWLNSAAQERLTYPTQKPVALLERIISASSNEGDVVLDPFCGCGTTIAAAQKLGRQWIGIDITHLSTGLMKLRLRDNFGLIPLGEKKAALPKSLKGTERIAQGKAEGRDPGNGSHTGADPEGGERSVTEDVAPLQGAEVGLDASPGLHPGLLSVSPSATGGTYRVIGEPEDLDSAKQLAQDDRYGFQWWILPLIGARSLGASDGSEVGKKGADAGIDGLMVFTDDNSGKAKKVIVSVKSGHVNVAQIRDLAHVVARENAAIGVFVTLEPPTRPMVQEAVTAGFYHSEYWHRDYPKIQILTVEQILSSKGVAYPGNMGNVNTFKRAEKIGKEPDDQWPLGFD